MVKGVNEDNDRWMLPASVCGNHYGKFQCNKKQ